MQTLKELRKKVLNLMPGKTGAAKVFSEALIDDLIFAARREAAGDGGDIESGNAVIRVPAHRENS